LIVIAILQQKLLKFPDLQRNAGTEHHRTRANQQETRLGQIAMEL
jgi:hypothetical protein